MKNQNPEKYKQLLNSQIQDVQHALFNEYPGNGLANHLVSGTRYNGNGKVEAYLSFDPEMDKSHESIDLTLSLSCTERGAIFATEILWSSGRMIDEVIVCEVCPECDEGIEEKVDRLMEKNRKPLVDRMNELYSNFYSN